MNSSKSPDTSEDIHRELTRRYMQLPGGKRVIICTGMFETAKALIYSSMPPNLNRYEQRKYFFKRMYGYDAPEQCLRAGE